MNELKCTAQMSKIIEEAHEYGLPVLLTVYPSFDKISQMGDDAYIHTCRIAEELGGDIIKTDLPAKVELFKKIVKIIQTPVVLSGGNIFIS